MVMKKNNDLTSIKKWTMDVARFHDISAGKYDVVVQSGSTLPTNRMALLNTYMKTNDYRPNRSTKEIRVRLRWCDGKKWTNETNDATRDVTRRIEESQRRFTNWST